MEIMKFGEKTIGIEEIGKAEDMTEEGIEEEIEIVVTEVIGIK
jgi:hypothetical protein